ncbi:shikimate dehydrogenase [Microbacterium gubbeenense]|uniref:shikimate dehydrogenase n=1 Tax=Microbacterium gubbeenense TaxID=159896 RepID=UPI003F9759C2
MRRLTGAEVWGAPIAHSRSPELHLAAYRALGLDWTFERRLVEADRFADELARASVRGLAVTVPLKDAAFRQAALRDRPAELTGAVNTLFFGDDEGLRGFNTDVGGLANALEESGVGGAETVRLVGSGATTTSALVAVSALGARRVEIAARRPERAAAMLALAARIGVPARAVALGEVRDPVDLTIATLPGGAELDPGHADALADAGGVLFDVAYSPWPSALAQRWQAEAHHGLGMLLHQAVLQVRIFVSGDADRELPDEAQVIRAMRDALG